MVLLFIAAVFHFVFDFNFVVAVSCMLCFVALFIVATRSMFLFCMLCVDVCCVRCAAVVCALFILLLRMLWSLFVLLLIIDVWVM